MKYTAHVFCGEYGDKNQYKYNVQIRINGTYLGFGRYCENMMEVLKFCEIYGLNAFSDDMYFEN